jgi:hypothetical protein
VATVGCVGRQLVREQDRPGVAGEDNVDRALFLVEAPAEPRLDEPDPAPQLVERNPAKAAAEDPRGAVARAHLGRRDPEQRRLAGPVRPHDAPVLAFARRPVEGVEDHLADAVRAAPEADLLEPDRVHARRL